MSDPVPFDEHAERLKIRSRPKPTARINRKILLVGSGVCALILFATASVALQPPTAATTTNGQELYNVENTRKPDGLASLPVSYGDVRAVPVLGPPLAGDLGSTILQKEKDLGIEPEYENRYQSDFRPNPEEEAARAARMRQAAVAEDAARAPIFFSLQSQAQKQKIGPESGRAPDALASELLALSGMNAKQAASFGVEEDANLQERKMAFASRRGVSDIYNPGRLEDPISPFQVMAGSIISASLITGINSDLPGSIIAQVTQPVYDTVTGTHLLIPQGSRVLGRYQSEVSFGQDRALVVWDRVIFPNGSSIQISAPGADTAGYAGLSDRTDHHWDRVFVAAGLATVLGIGSQLGEDSDDEIVRAIRDGTGQSVNQAGQRVVDRNLGIQPTVTVRPGWPVRILVTRDLILKPQQ